MNIRADFHVNCYLDSNLLKSEMKRPLKWFKQDNNYIVNVKATLYFTQHSYYEIYFLDKEIQSVNVEFKGIISENGIKNFIHCFTEDMSLSFNSIEDFKINSIKTKGQNKVITSKDYDFEKDRELLNDLKNIILDECSLNFEVETISEVIYE
jgi:hypothetical protein|nr:MAG TPA: hypothetical protein [Caudoviricetes sp.]